MRIAVVCAALLLAAFGQLNAQQADSVVSLDPLVVTAGRESTTLSSSTASVSVIPAEQLEDVPLRTLADALRLVPGFTLVDTDGLGRDPQVMARGFYGGGEAEYVVVMVDGRPVNDVTAGLVAWELLPLSDVERIEIVRGGASALWGDAAIGGVVNVITRTPGAGSGSWSLSGGSQGSWRAGVNATGRSFHLSGSFDRTDGFRDHAQRHAGSVRGTWQIPGSLRLTGRVQRREFDEPGPVPGSRLDDDRRGSEIFFRFDHTVDARYGAELEGERAIGTRAWLTGRVSGELRNDEAVRTVVLAPGFADTKERVLDTWRGGASVQFSVDGTGLPVADRLVAGVEATHGSLDAKYYAMLTGDASAYAGADGRRGELDTNGSGARTATAAFVQYTLLPTAAVRVSVGGRVDRLDDRFDVRAPEDPARLEATHTAFSPRIGLNVQYADDGNAYVTAGRSFKAPTLDQLFDRRRLPVPFPPFAITTSNDSLAPQYGTSVEAGLYQRASAGAVSALLSLSVYRMDMKDELDFDVESLRYVNIGRSRHTGVEAGLTLGVGATAAFANYTLQHAVARSGENAGHRLKAIPRHSVTGGVTVAPNDLEAAVLVTNARGIFVDDANTLTLPDCTRVDARIGYAIRDVRLTLDIRNLFDSRYSTTAFPDPAGSGELYYRPAAGRTLELGVSGSF